MEVFPPYTGQPRGGAGGTMTPGPMPFRGPIVGPIKITLYSEQQALLCKQRADYHTLEQRLTQTGFSANKNVLFSGGSTS